MRPGNTLVSVCTAYNITRPWRPGHYIPNYFNAFTAFILFAASYITGISDSNISNAFVGSTFYPLSLLYSVLKPLSEFAGSSPSFLFFSPTVNRPKVIKRFEAQYGFKHQNWLPFLFSLSDTQILVLFCSTIG